MKILNIPPEPASRKIAFPADQKLAIVQDEMATYLWKEWGSYLQQVRLSPNNLRALLGKKFSNEILEWVEGRKKWKILIKRMAEAIESNDIEYDFKFALFPKFIFGLPEGEKLIVPIKTEAARASDSLKKDFMSHAEMAKEVA